MKFIGRILFPVDFSRGCRSAARHVEAMAGRFEAEIMLLHVVADGEHRLADELLPARQRQLDSYLADELRRFTTRRVCIAGDDAADEIVSIARQWEPGLVMMSTHGHGPFRQFLVGSTTARVLEELTCPVWTGVHSEGVLPLGDIHCRRILCALDLGARSEYTLEWASAMAAAQDASLGVVHATSMMPRLVTSVGLADEMAGAITANARREIDRLCSTAGIDPPVFIDEGDPEAVITGTEKEFSADLLVMGRHDSGPQDGFAILRASPCPVITI